MSHGEAGKARSGAVWPGEVWLGGVRQAWCVVDGELRSGSVLFGKSR